MKSEVYFGTLRVWLNADFKPRGKRKVIYEHEKIIRDVKNLVWTGTDIDELNKRPHTVNFVAKVANVKKEKVKILGIVEKRSLGRSVYYEENTDKGAK